MQLALSPLSHYVEMKQTRDFLAGLDLPSGDAFDRPSSGKRFPDGAQYRVEIPSVEGPDVLEAVLEEAEQRKVLIHRVSQGSGIMLLNDAEIERMVKLGCAAGIEVSLFVGPRAAWDTGAQIHASAGKNLGARLRGMEQLVYALEDVRRACDLGIRSVLIADEGLLWLVSRMREAGELPAGLVVKVSVQMGAANPVSIMLVERLGADTYNIPTDLSLPQIAAVRMILSSPLDMYIEVPDDFGGFVRYYEAPEIVRIAAPVYLKLGLRNAPGIYPSGAHLQKTAVAEGRERVRRAGILLAMIQRYYPEAVTSARGAQGLGIPVI